MKFASKLFSIGILPVIASGCNTSKQAIPYEHRSSSISFKLVNDTLFWETNKSIYIGKKLTVGKGSGDNGRYQAITFKSPTTFPLLFLRNTEIENNPEYKVDPLTRDDDKVKNYLTPGQSLTVTKISSKGNGKAWHYYEVLVVDGRNKFKCDIGYAIELKELLLCHEKEKNN